MKAPYTMFMAILAGMLLAGCGNGTKPPTPAANSAPAQGLAALKQAVQTFNTQEGHFPKTLDELVPKYISQVPDAPGGYKFAYDPATGEVKLSR